MKSIGIIPARFSSTRLPGKPLANLLGKSLIQRVYENALLFNLDELIIATDSDEIYKHAQAFGAKVFMTPDTFSSGTERVAWLVKELQLIADVVINIQGDEPFTPAEDIIKLNRAFIQDEVQIATLACDFKDEKDIHRPSVVKIVLDENDNALYFSRSPIPFNRDLKDNWLNYYPYKRHIGIYAFRPNILVDMVHKPASQLEQIESLEQLRWLYYGQKIKVISVKHASISIDTPEDLAQAIQIIQSNTAFN